MKNELKIQTNKGLQAKAVKTLMAQSPAVTDRKLRGLVASSRVKLITLGKNTALKATSPSAEELSQLTESFALALTKTPKDEAKVLWMEMMSRGLSYRNDGKDLARAKKIAFQNMLTKYPMDAALTACRKLRAGGWWPSRDDVELEIIEMIEWRQKAYEALCKGEVLTANQIFDIKTRELSYRLSDALRPFPIYDNGKPVRREYYEAAIRKLKSALDAFKDHNGDTDDFIDRRSITQAHEHIAAPFIPYPYGHETAEQREQRMKGEREEREKAAAEQMKQLGVDYQPKETLSEADKAEQRRKAALDIAPKLKALREKEAAMIEEIR